MQILGRFFCCVVALLCGCLTRGLQKYPKFRQAKSLSCLKFFWTLKMALSIEKGAGTSSLNEKCKPLKIKFWNMWMIIR